MLPKLRLTSTGVTLTFRNNTTRLRYKDKDYNKWATRCDDHNLKTNHDR